LDRVFLTCEEAADVLHIGRSKVFELIRSGELVSIKIGRLRRVPVHAIQDFAKHVTEEGTMV
jgi:excisionase family DNA binding protein